MFRNMPANTKAYRVCLKNSRNYYLRFSRKLHAGSVSLQSFISPPSTSVQCLCWSPTNTFAAFMSSSKLIWRRHEFLTAVLNYIIIDKTSAKWLHYPIKFNHNTNTSLQIHNTAKAVSSGVIVHKHPKVWIKDDFLFFPFCRHDLDAAFLLIGLVLSYYQVYFWTLYRVS